MSKVREFEPRYVVSLPPPAKTLLEDGWKKYDGRFIKELPSYGSDPHTKMRVKFADQKAHEQGEEWDVDWESAAPRVPIALITFEDGEPDAQFLVIDPSDQKCPVLMFEHEIGKFKPVADSLDQFLSDLVDE